MKRKLAYLIVAAIAVVFILNIRGLAGTSAGPTPSSSPRATPTANPALGEWQTLGATQVPPPKTRVAPFPNSFYLLDLSNGVSQSDAATWGVGLANDAQFLTWALGNDQVDFLRNFESSSTPYSDWTAALQKSRNDHANTKLSGDLVITDATVLDLTDTDKSFISRWNQTPTDQGWRVTYRNVVTLTYGANQKQLTVNQTFAEGGRFASDPVLGPIWVDSFRMDCAGLGASLSLCQ